MMGKYETRQNTLVEETKKLERALEQDKVDLRVFLETIRKCTDIKELTPALVNRLIHRIEVHKSEFTLPRQVWLTFTMKRNSVKWWKKSVDPHKN